jgi:hypothetical protein
VTVGRHLEAHARAGGVLLEDQCDLLAAQHRLLGAGVLGGLQVGGELEQKADLVCREVAQGQQASVL